ncbi:MAG: hypothetical protein LWY06_00235, partial [Firmicutes bacterium]|nr:hypothetical protein [Bacillota bacterium]
MKAKFTLKIMIIPVILLFASVSAYADPKTSCRKENGSNIVKTSISKNDEFIQVSDGDNFYFVVSGNYKSNMDRSLTRNYLMKYSFKKNKMYSVRFPDILDFDSKKLICQDERNLFIRGEKGLYIADKSNFQIVGCIKEIDNKPVKVFSYGSRIYSASYLNVLLDDVRNESYLYYYKALNNKPSSGMLIWHKPGYGEEKVKGKVSVWRVKDRKKIFTYVTENYNSQPAVYDRRLYYCSSDTNAIRIRSVANTENNERVISLKNRAGIIK